MRITLGKRAGAASLVLFFALLVGLPATTAIYHNQPLALFDSFYRSGSLVFGGGHVVLPSLQSEVVPPGWVSNDAFLAGYGAAQAFPGRFSPSLRTWGPDGFPTERPGRALVHRGDLLARILLTMGVLPLWDHLRRLKRVRSTLVGVNAAVVELLLAAPYHPIWTSAVKAPGDFGLGVAAFALSFPIVPPEERRPTARACACPLLARPDWSLPSSCSSRNLGHRLLCHEYGIRATCSELVEQRTSNTRRRRAWLSRLYGFPRTSAPCNLRHSRRRFAVARTVPTL